MGKQPATVGGCRGLFCDFISSFALAEQVDLAEKAFHDALARRNEAQIAYLREPSVVTREAFEGAKTAEAIALEILDTEVRRLARARATTVTGLKLKASYAQWGGEHGQFGERCDLAAQRGFELLNPETRPAPGKGLTANSGAIGA